MFDYKLNLVCSDEKSVVIVIASLVALMVDKAWDSARLKSELLELEVPLLARRCKKCFEGLPGQMKGTKVLTLSTHIQLAS